MKTEDELNAMLGIGPTRPQLPLTLQAAKYTATRRLEKGSFGEVLLVFHSGLQRYFVVKHVKTSGMSRNEKRSIHNEIAVLQRLHHPNIVSYFEHFEEKSNVYMVMEYADGGDLHTFIRERHARRGGGSGGGLFSGGGGARFGRRKDQYTPRGGGGDSDSPQRSPPPPRSSSSSAHSPITEPGGSGLLLSEEEGGAAAFTETEVLHLFIQLLMAVKHLHARCLLHRDIKSKNVFLMSTASSSNRGTAAENGKAAAGSARSKSAKTSAILSSQQKKEDAAAAASGCSTSRATSATTAKQQQSASNTPPAACCQYLVKLGDFGISTVLRSQTTLAETVCGTPGYFSPEMCSGSPYNTKSDMWAMGVLLYEMCAGRLPFAAAPGSRNPKEVDATLMSAIRNEDPPRIPRCFSDDLWGVVCSLLEKTASRRPEAAQLLLHPLLIQHVPNLIQVLGSCEASAVTSSLQSTTGGGRSPPPRQMSARSSFYAQASSRRSSRGGARDDPTAPIAPASSPFSSKHGGSLSGSSSSLPRGSIKYFVTKDGVYLRQLTEDERLVAINNAGAGAGDSAVPQPTPLPVRLTVAETPMYQELMHAAQKQKEQQQQQHRPPYGSVRLRKRSFPSPVSSGNNSSTTPTAAAGGGGGGEEQQQPSPHRRVSEVVVLSPSPDIPQQPPQPEEVEGPPPPPEDAALLLGSTQHYVAEVLEELSEQLELFQTLQERDMKAAAQGARGESGRVSPAGPPMGPGGRAASLQAIPKSPAFTSAMGGAVSAPPELSPVSTTAGSKAASPMTGQLMRGSVFLQYLDNHSPSFQHCDEDFSAKQQRSSMALSANSTMSITGFNLRFNHSITPTSTRRRGQKASNKLGDGGQPNAKVGGRGDEEEEDLWVEGLCVCGQVAFRSPLSSIFGSFLCACEVCQRYDYSYQPYERGGLAASTGSSGAGATGDHGIEWLHLPMQLTMEDVVLTTATATTAGAGQGSSRDQKSDSKRTPACGDASSSQTTGLNSFTFSGSKDDETDEEEGSGGARVGTTTVYFCRRCGMLFGAQHEEVEGVVIHRGVLSWASRQLLDSFANPTGGGGDSSLDR